MFFEICEGKLTLTNTGKAPFSVKMTSDEDTDNPEPGWLTVHPKHKTIQCGEGHTFLVRYFPGLTGHFSKKFLAEVCIRNFMSII